MSDWRIGDKVRLLRETYTGDTGFDYDEAQESAAKPYLTPGTPEHDKYGGEIPILSPVGTIGTVFVLPDHNGQTLGIDVRSNLLGRPVNDRLYYTVEEAAAELERVERAPELGLAGLATQSPMVER